MDTQIIAQNFHLPFTMEDYAFSSVKQEYYDIYDINHEMIATVNQWNDLSEALEGFGLDIIRAMDTTDLVQKGDITLVARNNTAFDKENLSIIFEAIAPYVTTGSFLTFENEIIWRCDFLNKELEEKTQINYNYLSHLTMPKDDVYIISIQATDEYPGGIIGAAYTIDEARAIAQASCNMTDGAFTYEIMKISPGKIDINNQIYHICIKDGKVISTELKDSEPIFETIAANINYPEL